MTTMVESRLDVPVCDVGQWKLGSSLTVVVPTDEVSHFVEILSAGEHSSLCDVLSVNGITINFRPEKDWSFEADSGMGWIQLAFGREDDSSDCHVLARNFSRAQAREIAVGLTGPTPVMVPLMMNYLDEVTSVAEVPVYFTAAGTVTRAE